MKIIKKSLVLSLVMILTITSMNLHSVFATYKLPFELQSQAVYMVNTDTGTVVYEKNANQKLYPASLTKIMTAVIALETVSDLEGTVVTAPAYVYDEFYGMGVSTADIRQYEEVRMIDLLYAMMLQSACEASSIIADYVGGGNISEFVELMNKKAKEIGAVDTTFKNAHGLFHEQQVTTAHDMYLISNYAMSIPMFEKISTTVSYEMPATNKHEQPRYVTHTNSMLSRQRGGSMYYEYAKGIKTGSLPEVGKNLVSMASKDSYNYMLVTLGAPAKDATGAPLPNGSFVDAMSLYKWAFQSFQRKVIVKQDEIADETNVFLSTKQDFVTLLAKNEVSALLPIDSDVSTIQRIKTLQKDIRAPIKKGTVLGRMDLKLNDNIIASVDLIASENVERSFSLYVLDVLKRFMQTTIVQVLLVILVMLILIYIIMNARYQKLKRLKNARARYNK